MMISFMIMTMVMLVEGMIYVIVVILLIDMSGFMEKCCSQLFTFLRQKWG